ncbi:MAG: S1 RNA-binding domain-containing protein [Intestinibacter bartlettii]|uniref:30S ribosomal protein S1 n=1 Tax=Intestinibacter bartlettii TaxID=261299 RepID=UPI0026ECC4AB|nr:S1 RNA-binding domain-containing protein [Intestinibacter bartlettii]MDO5009619.1 S1 RNA-binding domain-containing protein [Intestinibacter bartlettii]
MTNELSMQELLEQQEQQLDKLKVGELITNTITKVTHDVVVLGLDCGFDGIIGRDDLNIEKDKEIADVYKVGDEITAVITKVSPKDGTVRLSKVLADQENDLKDLEVAFNEHKIVTAYVEKAIPRGVFAKYKSVQLFIPISQIDTKFVNDTHEYVGANLEVYVIEFNENRNKYVASHREVLQERINIERKERKEKEKAERDAERARVKEARQNIFDSLEVGQKIHGKVTKIMPYGAFIDIGEGLEGLAHINNLAWKRVESVEDVVTEGQEIDVYVLEVNKENNRIALAVKDINNDPWQLIAKEVAVGDVITGKVVRTIDRGAFVEIKEGVEAYLPISQLSENRVPTVNSVVNPGDEIEAKILNFQPEEKRMLISIKEVNAEPEEDYTQFMKPEESLGATIGDAMKKAGK